MKTAAVIQLNCTSDSARNLQRAEALIREAASHGASLVCTPENTNFLGPPPEKVARAEGLDGPTCTLFAALAKELSIELLLGSFNEKGPSPDKCYNTSVLFGPDGKRLAVYRKIHLFDIDLNDEVRFMESDHVAPGDEVVVALSRLGGLGMAVCYDLRFAELFAALRRAGASLITLPSAFTLTTGRAHWEPLLRARSIETQCYLLAPAQYGFHDDDGLRESFGHAMIVDPWGQVVAMAADGEGFALAPIDSERIEKVRRAMPVEAHRRLGRGG